MLWAVSPAESTTYGLSNLTPEKVFCCPNETVKFTCSGERVWGMEWSAEPFISKSEAIKYIIMQLSGDAEPVNRSNIFFSEVPYLKRWDENTADMITILRVRTSEMLNGTNITCSILLERDIHYNWAILYVAGLLLLKCIFVQCSKPVQNINCLCLSIYPLQYHNS